LLRLLAFICFIFGFCLTLLTGWHWSQAEDGEQVAWVIFYSGSEDNQDIYRVRWDGTHVQNLTHTYGLDWVLQIMPNYQGIIFSSWRSGSYELYRMQLDGSQLRNIPYPLCILCDVDARISPDGQWIFFEIADADENYNVESQMIYRMRLDGSHLQNLTPQLPDVRSVVAFTLDGQWVLFQTSSVQAGIYRMRLNGQDLQFLNQIPKGSSFVTLAPNGQWAIFNLIAIKVGIFIE
jgi:Tol biopolymer transport system component